MSKKVLIISTSLRQRSNSDALAEAFAVGAREAGHQVEKISLTGRNIGFCQGCLACLKTGRCVLKDDAPAITEKIHDADVLVFSTPIYYYDQRTPSGRHCKHSRWCQTLAWCCTGQLVLSPGSGGTRL